MGEPRLAGARPPPPNQPAHSGARPNQPTLSTVKGITTPAKKLPYWSV